MNTNEGTPSGVPEEAKRRKLVENLTKALLGDHTPEPVPTVATSIPESVLMGIVRNVGRKYAVAQRWRVVAADGVTNPLAGALVGAKEHVHILDSNGGIALHGTLALNLVETKPAPYEHESSEIWTLKGDSGDDDDSVGSLWDDVEALGSTSFAPPAEVNSLWLVCPEWPADLKLGDVTICSEDDPDPLAVMTVRRIGNAFQLNFDAEDRSLLSCDSVRVDLRLLSQPGTQ